MKLDAAYFQWLKELWDRFIIGLRVNCGPSRRILCGCKEWNVGCRGVV